MISLLLLLLLLILTVYTCYSDVSRRVISNEVVVAVLVLGVVIVATTSGFSVAFGTTIIILLVGFILSILNIIGGGDVKLFAVYSLVIKPEYMFLVFIIMTMIGGLLAVYTIGVRFFTKSVGINNLSGIPYGVAISVASYIGVVISVLSSNIYA